MSTEPRQFNRAFKVAAVRRVTEGGQSRAHVGRDLQVGRKTVGRWVRQFKEQEEEALRRDDRPNGDDCPANRLMRENRRLREERDILKQAVAIVSERKR